MNIQQITVGILTVTYIAGAAMLLPGLAKAQDAKVQAAMELLESSAAKLGPPKIEGVEAVAGKEAPAIYFGSTKMNNNVDLVDQVVKKALGTATIFVKSGDEYVRVATNVRRDDGSRVRGTILDPNGKAIEAIRQGEAYYGQAEILGRPYVTGYKPIRDSSNNVIGLYYIGYIIDCSASAEELQASGCQHR